MTNERPRARMPSNVLSQTLQELEKALDSWDKVGSCATSPLLAGAAPSNTASCTEEVEFKKKTRELLQSLREQLESL